MSDIAPRPWAWDSNNLEVEDAGRYVVANTSHSDFRTEEDDANAAHIVACVNAIHFAGITPAALAADPDCLRRLLSTLSLIDRVFLPRNPNKMRVAAPEVVAAVKEFRAALRACGIEVGP